MDKGIIALAIGAFFLAHANASEPLFDYKQLDADSTNFAYINRFSDSRMFNCYKDGKVILKFGVGIPAKSLYIDGGRAIESEYMAKYKKSFDWKNLNEYISIQAGVDTKHGFKESYDSIGKPLFDSNENLKYMVVELLNGKKIEFTRFGPIPDFPFNSKKKLNPFFYYQVEGEPRYECGAISQPD